jgi:hypothetical protein
MVHTNAARNGPVSRRSRNTFRPCGAAAVPETEQIGRRHGQRLCERLHGGLEKIGLKRELSILVCPYDRLLTKSEIETAGRVSGGGERMED